MPGTPVEIRAYRLDGKYKSIIPLRRVFIPESLTEE